MKSVDQILGFPDILVEPVSVLPVSTREKSGLLYLSRMLPGTVLSVGQ